MVAGQQQDLFFLSTKELEERVTKVARQYVSKPVQRIFWNSLKELGEHNPEAYRGELRVTLIGEQVARFVNFDPKGVVIGAETHDIGKKDIPSSTLDKSYSNKYGPWLPSDDEMMRIHPYLGYIHLMSAAERTRLSFEDRIDVLIGAWIALTHHHTQQDRPYPLNLPEPPRDLTDSGLIEVIGEATRLVRLSDQYEACYRNNPKYGRQLNHDEARDQMFTFNPQRDHDLIRRLFDEDTGIF